MSKIGRVLKTLATGKMLVGGILVGVIVVFSASSVANAAPSYFDVEKPSSPSQCEGFTTSYHWEWRWERHTSGPWWTWFFWGHWVQVPHQTPNWKELGFSSKGQCIRYTTTEAPDSRRDCRDGGWWRLGFNSRGQCNAYVRLHGGGGYGGDA